MTRILLAVSLAAALACAGCGPADKSTDKQAKPPENPPAAKPAPPKQPGPEAKPAPAAAKPRYTAQQIAEAKESASQLGAKMVEDADGNVTLLNFASGRSWAGDAQVGPILVFEKLQSLTVEGPGITEALVPRIAALANLTSLALRNTLIGDKGIAQLTGLRKLKIIELPAATQVHDAAMESLAKMSELRAVRLVGDNVTDAGVARLMELPHLTELDVRNCRGVTRKGIELAAAKKTLRVLKIGGPKIGDDVLKVVAGMTNLTGLSLDNSFVTDAAVARLDKLPLEDLTLYQCPNVTDKGLEVLSSYGNLERLTLSDVGAKGAALAALPHPEKLTALDMAQSRITDAEVPNLAKLKALRTLDLSQTAVTDAAIDTLAKMTSLRKLVLSQTGISEAGMDRLRKALPGCAIRAN